MSGWILKGHRKATETTGSRTRLNILIINVILDGALYRLAQQVTDRAEVVNIKLHLLAAYSLNLNPTERMWKLMNEHTRNNRYFSSTREFRNVISTFLNKYCRI